MDPNEAPNNPPPFIQLITPRPGMLVCYLLNGVCVAMANGHDSNRRMAAPTNNTPMTEIFSILGIKEDNILGVEIHFVEALIA